LNFLLVGFGGILGGFCRFQLGKVVSRKSHSSFPLGTLLINISGAFLLGLLSSHPVNNRVYLLLGDGFLGAYTTFSTFMYEGFHLFEENKKLNAFVYVLGSLVIGVVGFVGGFALPL
jgi:fluoride exporter